MSPHSCESIRECPARKGGEYNRIGDLRTGLALVFGVGDVSRVSQLEPRGYEAEPFMGLATSANSVVYAHENGGVL